MNDLIYKLNCRTDGFSAESSRYEYLKDIGIHRFQRYEDLFGIEISAGV
jgi:hypothetical protein